MITAHDRELVDEFVNAFEEVFDRDWEYTRQVLGIFDETVAQEEAAAELGLESIPIIADNGTFIEGYDLASR